MRTYKVSELNNTIKNYLSYNNELHDICVEGEVSGVTIRDPHMYFSIKDATSTIGCNVFKYKLRNIPKDLKEGDNVKVYGDISLYDKTSTLKINCRSVEKSMSIGDLYVLKEELKKKYHKLGYFSQSIKKELPKFIKKIGVVTSHTGAAVHDIIRTTHNRNPNVDILIYSVKVQGDGASLEIARAIDYLNANYIDEIDCLIVGRGGGSIEDLWAFNEENVIEAIYRSNIPVISAVGHEIDNLISDLVADKSASTPTQAAEILVIKKEDYIKELSLILEKLNTNIITKLNNKKNELSYISNHPRFSNFIKYSIDSKRNILKDLENRIKSLIKLTLSTKKQRDIISDIKNKLDEKLKSNLVNKKRELENLMIKIEKFNNDDILERGFSITLVNGMLIKDAKLKVGDKLETIYSKNRRVNSEVYE